MAIGDTMLSKALLAILEAMMIYDVGNPLKSYWATIERRSRTKYYIIAHNNTQSSGIYSLFVWAKIAQQCQIYKVLPIG